MSDKRESLTISCLERWECRSGGWSDARLLFLQAPARPLADSVGPKVAMQPGLPALARWKATRGAPRTRTSGSAVRGTTSIQGPRGTIYGGGNTRPTSPGSCSRTPSASTPAMRICIGMWKMTRSIRRIRAGCRGHVRIMGTLTQVIMLAFRLDRCIRQLMRAAVGPILASYLQSRSNLGRQAPVAAARGRYGHTPIRRSPGWWSRGDTT